MEINFILNGKHRIEEIKPDTVLLDLEGLQDEAKEFGAFIADQGAEQCGFCNPGFMMNAMALLRDNPDPTDDEIREYLSGNLCRCSGYESQMRGIKAYISYKKEAKDE